MVKLLLHDAISRAARLAGGPSKVLFAPIAPELMRRLENGVEFHGTITARRCDDGHLVDLIFTEARDG